jgi:hypothetical protein
MNRVKHSPVVPKKAKAMLRQCCAIAREEENGKQSVEEIW